MEVSLKLNRANPSPEGGVGEISWAFVLTCRIGDDGVLGSSSVSNRLDAFDEKAREGAVWDCAEGQGDGRPVSVSEVRSVDRFLGCDADIVAPDSEAIQGNGLAFSVGPGRLERSPLNCSDSSPSIPKGFSSSAEFA